MEIVFFAALAAVLLVSALFGVSGAQPLLLIGAGVLLWKLWRRTGQLEDELGQLRQELQILAAAQRAAKHELRHSRAAELAPVPLDPDELRANAAEELARAARAQATKRDEATAPPASAAPWPDDEPMRPPAAPQPIALATNGLNAAQPLSAQATQADPSHAARHAAPAQQALFAPGAHTTSVRPQSEPPPPLAETPAQAASAPPPAAEPATPQRIEPVMQWSALHEAPNANRPPPEPRLASASALEPDEQSLFVVSSLARSVLAWFRGGNAIVRIAALILLLGVVFLLSYATEHIQVPIALRLAVVAAGGLALLRTGRRTVSARRAYGLTLQGAGIAVLYLTLYAAFRRYELLPAGLAFMLLGVLASVTAVLAVRQNALPLAVLGFSGGFLAPVLTSSGQGSYAALFTYYLLLNLAIAWLAARQTWKLLNLVGCSLTFGVGLVWGALNWRPEMLRSTEPFLVAHIALYLYISVQYSRQLLAAGAPSQGLRYVDGGLLFGMPIAAFALQAGMVKHLPYALAASAAVLGATYLALARWVWRISGERAQLLTEAILALGVIFVALALPLALDAQWSGAAWAIQGAGVAWLALRQKRPWALLMGVVLIVGATLSFWAGLPARSAQQLLFANGIFTGGAVLALAALAVAHQTWQQMHAPGPADPRGWISASSLQLVHAALLGLGVLLALAAGMRELRAANWPELDWSTRTVGLLLLWTLLSEWLHKRLRWPALTIPARILFGLALLISADAGSSALLSSHVVAWRRLWPWDLLQVGALLLTGWWLLRRLDLDPEHRRGSVAAEHLMLAWYAAAQGAMKLYLLSDELIAHRAAWSPTALILIPGALALWLVNRWQHMQWPVAQHALAYRNGFALPALALLLAWVAGANLLANGSMLPLPYLPLLNPIDLGHLLILLYTAALAQVCRQRGLPLSEHWIKALGIAAFWWINGLLVRTLHHWADTPMWLDGTLRSSLLQTALTIWWTLTAMSCMLYATHKSTPQSARLLWSAGAGLLGVVVVKLLLVDLSDTGTLARIVSFIGVGLLMLVIGYVSPLPPVQNGASARHANV